MFSTLFLRYIRLNASRSIFSDLRSIVHLVLKCRCVLSEKVLLSEYGNFNFHPNDKLF